jgi:hypothetical protein
MKDWEIIADKLSKAGWSLGWVSAIDSNGRTIWVAESAHRGDGKRFIVRADEKLTAFLELESAIRAARYATGTHRVRKKRRKFSSYKSFSSSRNGGRAAPESGIRTATNGQSFTKYPQRALARTLSIDDLTTNPPTEIFRFRKISRTSLGESRRRMMKGRNT